MGPDQKTYTVESLGEWLKEEEIDIAFVTELTPFYNENLENLYSFSNQRTNYHCKRFDTIDEAVASCKEKLVIFPLASYVDWDKFFLKHELKDFPMIIVEDGQSGVRQFQSESDIQYWLDDALIHLCPWPTEKLFPKEEYDIPENDLTDLVSVGNGLCVIHKAILFPEIENFTIIDISSEQLAFTKWVIENWDGVEPFYLFQKRFSGKDIIPNRRWLYENAKMSVEDIQDALIRMQNATYIQQDIIPYVHDKPAVYYLSNCINYWPRALEHHCDVLLQQEKEYAKDKPIVFFGRKIAEGYLYN